MRILITNDDGVDNRGVHVLQDVAREFGDPIIVAPDRDRSGIGHAITLTRPLRVRQLGPDRWAVESGTPTDCVYLALHHILADAKPALVLSGINPGPNLGWDVHYSGTAAGAREGVLQGVPAISFSLVSGGRGYPFEGVAPWVRAVIRRALVDPPPELTFYNVNFPNPRVGAIRGIRTTHLGRRYYAKEVLVREDPRGREYLWIGGGDVYMPDMPGSDCNAIKDGYVSVTPLACDATSRPAMAAIEDWSEVS